tara:strand:- start:436 stop:606 length:171 start_codon:yes stop_codon:yes gene_type:complete
VQPLFYYSEPFLILFIHAAGGYITSKMFEKLKMNMMLIYPYLHKQKVPQERCVIII